jgi:hypothetical protein
LLPFFELITLEIITTGNKPVFDCVIFDIDDFLSCFRRVELYETESPVHSFLGTVPFDFYETDLTETAEVVVDLLGSEAGLDATNEDDILTVERHC